jgi:hypothetical protein
MPTEAKTTTKTVSKAAPKTESKAKAEPEEAPDQSGFLPLRRLPDGTTVELHGKSWVPVEDD